MLHWGKKEFWPRVGSPEHTLSPNSGMGSLQKEQTLPWKQPNPALGSAQSAGLLPG